MKLQHLILRSLDFDGFFHISFSRTLQLLSSPLHTAGQIHIKLLLGVSAPSQLTLHKRYTRIVPDVHNALLTVLLPFARSALCIVFALFHHLHK